MYPVATITLTERFCHKVAYHLSDTKEKGNESLVVVKCIMMVNSPAQAVSLLQDLLTSPSVINTFATAVENNNRQVPSTVYLNVERELKKSYFNHWHHRAPCNPPDTT